MTRLQSVPALPTVQRLIDCHGDRRSRGEFFAGACSRSTEFIAEALGATLAHAPGYTCLFERGRAIWMEVHTVPHDGEPSHEDIVMDFATGLRYVRSSPGRIEELVHAGASIMFAAAANEVEAYYGEALSIAAE